MCPHSLFLLEDTFYFCCASINSVYFQFTVITEGPFFVDVDPDVSGYMSEYKKALN